MSTAGEALAWAARSAAHCCAFNYLIGWFLAATRPPRVTIYRPPRIRIAVVCVGGRAGNKQRRPLDYVHSGLTNRKCVPIFPPRLQNVCETARSRRDRPTCNPPTKNCFGDQSGARTHSRFYSSPSGRSVERGAKALGSFVYVEIRRSLRLLRDLVATVTDKP